MKLSFFKLWPLAFLLAIPLRADDAPLVVASIRQYQVKGESTIHHYLYGLDGKLRQQLTADPGQDDHSPAFSHDGKSVLFKRVTTGAGLPNQSGQYILNLADGKITRLRDETAAQPDYTPTIPTTEFNDLAFEGNSLAQPDPAEGKDALSFTAKDKSAKLIETNTDADSAFKLKMADDKKPRVLSTFHGYEKSSDADIEDGYLTSKEGPFLVGPAHYGALFVNRHRDSMWAFDVRQKIWHKIQAEWVPGDIYAPQGKAGFYFVRCSLEPLGDTGKTVGSAYLEWWDAHFHRVILAPPLSVTYGAATYYGNGETSCFVDEQRGS